MASMTEPADVTEGHTVALRRGDLVCWYLDGTDGCKTVTSSVCGWSPACGTVLIWWPCPDCGANPLQWVRPEELVWLGRPQVN